MLSSTAVRIALVLALIFGLRQINATAAVAVVAGCIAFAIATILNVRAESRTITRSPAEFRLSIVGDAFLFTAATILGLQPGGSWGVGAWLFILIAAVCIYGGRGTPGPVLEAELRQASQSHGGRYINKALAGLVGWFVLVILLELPPWSLWLALAIYLAVAAWWLLGLGRAVVRSMRRSNAN